MPGPHLTAVEREVIDRMFYAGESRGKIAAELGRSKSVISRELKRNRDAAGTYTAREASEKAAQRRVEAKSEFEHWYSNPRLYEYVTSRLRQDWSPEQICGRLSLDHPDDVSMRVSHELSLEMLATHGKTLPHSWIAGDDEMGRPYWFRKALHDLGEHYLLAVPSNTHIRDLEIDAPAHARTGDPKARPWIQVDQWVAARESDEWTEINVRDGAKGPLIVETIKRCVVAKASRVNKLPNWCGNDFGF